MRAVIKGILTIGVLAAALGEAAMLFVAASVASWTASQAASRSAMGPI